MKRMTDERLGQILGLVDRFPKTVNGDYLRELLQALKAEREAYNVQRDAKEQLVERISELEAQNKRLISRGFEDLHYENEQLKAKLERVQCAADELAEALADD